MFLFVNNNSGILFLSLLEEIVEAIKREVFRGLSYINKSVTLMSTIDKD